MRSGSRSGGWGLLASRDAASVQVLGGLIADLMNLEKLLEDIARAMPGRQANRAAALRRLLTPDAADRQLCAALFKGEHFAGDLGLQHLYRHRAIARRLEPYLIDRAESLREQGKGRLTEHLIELAWRCVLGYEHSAAGKPSKWKEAGAGLKRSIPRWLTAEGAVALANEARAVFGDTEDWARATDVQAALEPGRSTQSLETRVRLVYNALAKGSKHVELAPDPNRAAKGRKLIERVTAIGAAFSDTERDVVVTKRSVRARTWPTPNIAQPRASTRPRTSANK